MNVDNRILLTNEQQMELREWEQLFKAPAWEWLVKDAIAQKQQLEQALVYSVATEAEMYHARGMIQALDTIIHAEKATEAAYSQMIGDAEFTREELRESAGANS